MLLGWLLLGMYSINVHMCYFTRITLTVVLCCFQCCSQDFGCSHGDTNCDGATRRLCESKCCWDGWSKVGIASMCICVILLESFTQSFCCAVFNVAARILDAVMAIPTVMARLIGFVSLIVAWMIAHRYV